MPTTSNFGWTTPADTDLVKDGASAIRTLGNGVDSSMAQLKGGTTGQILSKTSNSDMAFTWIANDQGDITAVTAGTGLTGGGTSGAVTVSLSSPVAATLGGTAQTTYASGDLLYASATDTLAKRSIGTTGQILTVSGGLPTWTTPASTSGMTLVTRQTISGSSGTNIDSIFTSSYDNYFIIIDKTNGTATSNDLRLQFRYGSTTQTSSVYKYFDFQWGNTVSSTEIAGDPHVTITPNVGDGNDCAQITMWISKVGGSSTKAQYQINLNNSSAGTPRLFNGKVNESQAYTGIRLTPDSGTFDCNISIYGLAK